MKLMDYHRERGFLLEWNRAIRIFSHVTEKGVEHDKNLSVTDPFAQEDSSKV
jgi:hypothetical protein